MNELVNFSEQEQITKFFNELTAKAKEIRATITPKKWIKERKGKGGQTFKYVKSDYLEQQLDEKYPGWSFETLDYKVLGRENSGYIAAHVQLIVYDKGLKRTISDIGGSEVKYYGVEHPRNGDYLDLPNDIKSAVTDGFKRCCYRLGFAMDMKFDPSDWDISEEKYGFIKELIDDLEKDVQDKIIQIAQDKVTEGNFNQFIKTVVYPKLSEVKQEEFNNYVLSQGGSR